MMPSVFSRIFEEAFGIRQVAAGGFGAVLMNGVKRGLFSNEAGSGSAPCAAAAAECDTPVKAGLTQALGVFIDTIVICSCTAMIMLTAPENIVAGKEGMDLLQSFYIDGRIVFQKIVDSKNLKRGIRHIVKLDPLNVVKVKIVPDRDRKTQMIKTSDIKEFYVYSNRKINFDQRRHCEARFFYECL